VVGLVERARAAVDEQDAARLAEKLRKSELTLDDFLDQLRQVKKMGPLEDLVKMLPGVPKEVLAEARPDANRLRRYEAILTSMTPKERRLPRVIDGSRRRRIAAGSGTTVPEVNQLLRDFDQARTMMKRLKHGPRGFARLKRGRA
jgi:signal recognition particle subunit SRP54